MTLLQFIILLIAIVAVLFLILHAWCRGVDFAIDKVMHLIDRVLAARGLSPEERASVADDLLDAIDEDLADVELLDRNEK